MPQAATPNMALIKPTENGDSGVWASLLDAMFDLIDQHDHSTGKGVKVSMLNSVTVAADIPWSSGGTFYAIKDLKAIDFQPSTQASVSTFAGALFVDSSNNELSYRTTGGAIIRFTNGATFNFSAIGAIGGDYSSVGALVDFVDASDFYRFRQQLGGGVQQYARLECGGVDLFEFKANPAVGVPANRVRLSSPTALGASYEMTWPGALPSSQVLLQTTSAGQVVFSNALAVNQDFTISGTARYRHGTFTLNIPGTAFQSINPGVFTCSYTQDRADYTGSNVLAAIPLNTSKRITAIRIAVIDSATGPTKQQATLSGRNSAGTILVITSPNSGVSSGAGSAQILTITPTPYTLAAGDALSLHVATTTGAASISVIGAQVDYDD